MRILFDGQQLREQMTGVGHYTDRVLRALLAHDRSHHWLVLCHSQNADHVLPIVADHPTASTVVLHEPLPVDYRVQQEMLAKLVPEVKASLYFSPSFLTAPRDVCPSVSVVHDVTYVLYPEFHPPGVAEYLHRCVANTCRNASRIIADSENSKQDVSRVYHYPADRITAVPLAADGVLFRPCTEQHVAEVRERLGLPERYVLAVNMGNPKKNAPMLLRAYAAVAPWLSGSLKLVIVGEWNPALVDIPMLAREAGIAEHVVLTGYVTGEDLRRLYAGAQILCFPSLHEGFGLPVLEAMASGLPVISSNAASLPEVAGHAAVLVDPRDETGWTAAIERLLSCEERRLDLSERGRRQASRFSWQDTARGILPVLESAASPDAGVEMSRSPSVSATNRRRRASSAATTLTILFVSRQPLTEIGGAQLSALTMLAELRRRGFDCHAVWPGSDRALQHDGITVHQVRSPASIGSLMPCIRPDAILSQLHWSPLAAQLAREHGVPHILFIRSFEPFCLDPLAYTVCDRKCSQCPVFRRHASFLKAQQQSIKGAFAVIANSKYMSAVVREFTGIDPLVVYPTIDFASVETGRGPREGILMCNPAPHKGGKTFFEIAHRMPEEQFLCVGGGDGPALPNIEYMGQSSPKAFYSRAKLLLVPSIIPEAFGRVAPEAMSNGIPVIASNIGGLPEAVGSGGILLNNYTDVQSWVNAIVHMLDPSVYASYARIAPGQAKRFEPERQMPVLLELLEACHA